MIAMAAGTAGRGLVKIVELTDADRTELKKEYNFDFVIRVVLPDGDFLHIGIPDNSFDAPPDYRYNGCEFGLNMVTRGHYI